MMLIDIKSPNPQVLVNRSTKYPVIVCSHERSGTHFLINSIAENSAYSADHLLNFDLNPLASFINFYDQEHISNFLKNMTSINANNITYSLASLIKTHHDSKFFEESFKIRKVKFLYILRDPYDTFVSLWKFINNFHWHEGKKTNSLFDFITSPPEGQMMRYQVNSYKTYFDRWANHTSGWLKASQENNNILVIRYEKLRDQYKSEIKKVLKFIDQPSYTIDEIKSPDREKFVWGGKKILNKKDASKSSDFIKLNIKKYNRLSKAFPYY